MRSVMCYRERMQYLEPDDDLVLIFICSIYEVINRVIHSCIHSCIQYNNIIFLYCIIIYNNFILIQLIIQQITVSTVADRPKSGTPHDS